MTLKSFNLSSTLKIFILAGIFSGFCITTADGITDDCDYIWSMIRLLPNLISDVFSCIADPKSKFLTPTFNPGNFMCIIRCVLIKGGMLDEDGAIEAVGALEFLASILPPKLKPKAEDLVVACQDATTKIDLVNDPSCMSYLPLLTCAIQELIKLFGGAVVDTITGENPVSIKKIIMCLLIPPPPPKDDYEGGDENAAEPESRRIIQYGFRRSNSSFVRRYF